MIWKNLPGIEKYYEVSNTGLVRRKQIPVIDRNGVPRKFVQRILKSLLDKKGYHRIRISERQIRYTIKVHRSVAIAFIPNPENKEQVNHIDGDKNNNCVENLEWVTNIENMRHAFAIGIFKERDKNTILNIKHMRDKLCR